VTVADGALVTVRGGSAGLVAVVAGGVVSVGVVVVGVVVVVVVGVVVVCEVVGLVVVGVVVRIGVDRVAVIAVESAPALPPPPQAASEKPSTKPEIRTAARVAAARGRLAERPLTSKGAATTRS
jgi:hypothetical protein